MVKHFGPTAALTKDEKSSTDALDVGGGFFCWGHEKRISNGANVKKSPSAGGEINAVVRNRLVVGREKPGHAEALRIEVKQNKESR